MRELLGLLQHARLVDLSQPFHIGMPHYPTHPAFLFSLTKRHGDAVLPNGASSASEAFTMGGHSGTHIDALCHYAKNGRLYGGVEAEAGQTYAGGVGSHAIDAVAPVLRRGVLLDIARQQNTDVLPEDFEILPEHLEAAACMEIGPGDVVLIRTGWARFWGDARRYVNGVRSPGPADAGARWLSRRGVFAAGSDTLTFEKVPSATMPAHTHLLAECGIHIIESLNLEELAASGIPEFIFVAAPLPIRGGTGSPVRAFALLES